MATKFNVQEARDHDNENTKRRMFDVSSIYQEYYETVGRCDRLSVDIIHDIEFSNFTMKDGYKKAKELKTVKQERRQAKELMEYLTLIKNFSDNNQGVIQQLRELISDFDKTAEEQSKRVYVPRESKNIDSARQHFEQNLEKQLKCSD